MKIDDIEVERLQAIDLRSTDILVVEIKDRVAPEGIKNACDYIKRATGHTGRIVVLTAGATLNIVRPEQS